MEKDLLPGVKATGQPPDRPHHGGNIINLLALEQHHGGAGTTAAGLRAGVPTIIVAHIADQHYFGQVLEPRGVGTAPIPRGKLSVERLVNAINTVFASDAMHDKAAQLGEKIRAEDGIGNAMRVIEDAIKSHQ